MKRLLLATAMTVTLLVPAKADVNYDTIKGMAYMAAYENSCKPGSLTPAILWMMDKILAFTPENWKTQAIAEVAGEYKSMGKILFCSTAEMAIGSKLPEVDANARRAQRSIY